MACVIWIFDVRDSTRRSGSSGGELVLDFTPETLTRIIINNKGNPPIELTRSDGNWMIVNPVEARADFTAVNKLLYAMEILSAGEMITAAERKNRALSLENYGLAEPRTAISLSGPDGRHMLCIGRTAPLGETMYIRIPPDDVVIAVSTNILSVIPENHNTIRDRKLLGNTLRDVRRVEIRRPGRPTVQMTKQGSEWFIESPVFARADWNKTRNILETLFEMEIKSFVSDTTADLIGYGLSEEESPLQVTVWTVDGGRGEKIVFGKPVDNDPSLVYSSVGDGRSIYAVDAKTVGVFDAGVAWLRDPSLYFMSPDKIGSVRIRRPENVLEITRAGREDWKILSPIRCDADSGQVRVLINSLNALPVQEFVDGATNIHDTGIFENPVYFVSVEESSSTADAAANNAADRVEPVSGRRLVVALAEQETGNRVMARFADSESIYELNSSVVNIFSSDANLYRDKTVLDLEPSSIIRISLDISGSRHVAEFDRDKNEWRLVEPAERRVNNAAIKQILGFATNLQALRFLPQDQRPTEAYGFKQPRAVLTLGLREEDGISKSLLFGDISEDLGVYAMLQGQDVVFVVDKTMVESILNGLAY